MGPTREGFARCWPKPTPPPASALVQAMSPGRSRSLRSSSSGVGCGFGACALLFGLACTDVVPLGSWTQLAPVLPTPPAVDAEAPRPPQPEASTPAPTTTTPVELDAAVAPSAPVLDASQAEAGPARLDASAPEQAQAPLPACGAVGNPGPTNAWGLDIAPTETSTDWTWSAPADSIQWELMIEREIVRPPSGPNGGYYWFQQFSFVQGVAGIIGLQAEGIYQATLAMTPDVTKMAVFWVSGPPLDAELGDIAYPDARVAEETAAGATWTTIHARFDWQACHVYRMRFAPEVTEAGGNTWYGARILDKTTDQEILLGRVLLPADVGQISPFSISRTSAVDWGSPAECSALPYGSAVFGAPMAVDGSHLDAAHSNRFSQSARCGTSRFTDFPGAVRHELATPP
jgi:hypothetical protein